MVDNSITSGNGDPMTADPGCTAPSEQPAGLELGRLIVTRLLFGQLEVYKKKNGTIGISLSQAHCPCSGCRLRALFVPRVFVDLACGLRLAERADHSRPLSDPQGEKRENCSGFVLD